MHLFGSFSVGVTAIFVASLATVTSIHIPACPAPFSLTRALDIYGKGDWQVEVAPGPTNTAAAAIVTDSAPSTATPPQQAQGELRVKKRPARHERGIGTSTRQDQGMQPTKKLFHHDGDFTTPTHQTHVAQPPKKLFHHGDFLNSPQQVQETQQPKKLAHHGRDLSFPVCHWDTPADDARVRDWQVYIVQESRFAPPAAGSPDSAFPASSPAADPATCGVAFREAIKRACGGTTSWRCLPDRRDARDVALRFRTAGSCKPEVVSRALAGASRGVVNISCSRLPLEEAVKFGVDVIEKRWEA